MKLSELAKQIEDCIAEKGDVEVWVKPLVNIVEQSPRFRIKDEGGYYTIHLYDDPIY